MKTILIPTSLNGSRCALQIRVSVVRTAKQVQSVAECVNFPPHRRQFERDYLSIATLRLGLGGNMLWSVPFAGVTRCPAPAVATFSKKLCYLFF